VCPSLDHFLCFFVLVTSIYLAVVSVLDCPPPIVLIVVVWILHDATSTVYVVKGSRCKYRRSLRAADWTAFLLTTSWEE
jgi:hypothetical protein